MLLFHNKFFLTYSIEKYIFCTFCCITRVKFNLSFDMFKFNCFDFIYFFLMSFGIYNFFRFFFRFFRFIFLFFIRIFLCHKLRGRLVLKIKIVALYSTYINIIYLLQVPQIWYSVYANRNISVIISADIKNILFSYNVFILILFIITNKCTQSLF